MSVEYISGAIQGNLSVDDLIDSCARSPMQWQEPTIFDLSNEIDAKVVKDRFTAGDIQTTYDTLPEIVDELYEIAHPDGKADEGARTAFVTDVKNQGTAFGKWVLMPWSKELVRYADKDDHRALRTSRNRNLVTAEEQQKLYDATVVVFGLSVGSNVLRELVISGIGGKVISGDADVIATSNLNRINGGQTDVGVRKVDLAARKISEIDPYIEQVHFPHGITGANVHQLAAEKPSIVFDEVDNLAAKATLRLFAQEQGIPLVMATDVGNTSIIDVERYDTQPDTQPFNGLLTAEEITKLQAGALSPEETRNYMLKVVGMQNIGKRALGSLMEVGKTLPGIPQLGVTASMGAALATVAAREILLGHDLPSGRYIDSPENVLHLSA